MRTFLVVPVVLLIGLASGAQPVEQVSPTPVPAARPQMPQPVQTDTATMQKALMELSSRVEVLQAQVTELRSALQITPGGVKLQGASVSIVSGGNVSVESARDFLTSAGGRLSLQSDGDLNASAGASARLQVGGALSVLSAQDIAIQSQRATALQSAAAFSLQAGTAANISVGAATLRMDKSGVVAIDPARDVTINAAGNVAIKAGNDLTMKGSRVLTQ